MTKHISRLKIKCVSDVEKRDIKGKKNKKKVITQKKKIKKKYNQKGTRTELDFLYAMKQSQGSPSLKSTSSTPLLSQVFQSNVGLTFSFNILILYCVLCQLSSSCILCNHSCQFLGIVHFLLPLRYSLTFIFNKFSHNDKGQTFYFRGTFRQYISFRSSMQTRRVYII